MPRKPRMTTTSLDFSSLSRISFWQPLVARRISLAPRSKFGLPRFVRPPKPCGFRWVVNILARLSASHLVCVAIPADTHVVPACTHSNTPRRPAAQGSAQHAALQQHLNCLCSDSTACSAKGLSISFRIWGTSMQTEGDFLPGAFRKRTTQ